MGTVVSSRIRGEVEREVRRNKVLRPEKIRRRMCEDERSKVERGKCVNAWYPKRKC
jgi:hypothetical protein